MFDLFAPSHLILIAIAILIFIGPKDLPRFMHAVGKWTGKARRLADEFREGLNQMEQTEELNELRNEIAKLRTSRQQNFADEHQPHPDASAGQSRVPTAGAECPELAALS